ncbi:oligosaccharide flippase family protein [Stenotrophomonas sp. YIM B06876]|uniref:lipopolysaccharide biosynthesis protein n=1 Tax=Stenotrophomonas sp. YIM B06876 TaxID=3060211 RepID=UPI0027394128|nr:oligosaccharide flippase family protein [Stenotrophomonas sp. YIM B06876]
MIKKIAHIRKILLEGSRYKKNLIHGALANAFTQAVPLLVLPILTRLYVPDDFGTLSIYVAIISILGSVATFRMDWFVSATRNRFRAAVGLALGLALLICVLLASIVMGALFLLSSPASNTGIFSAIRPVAWLIPIGVAGYSLFSLTSAWYVRQARIRALSSSRMIQGVIGAAVGIALGFAGAGAVGLVGGSIANTSAGVVKLFRDASSELFSAATRIRSGYIKKVAAANARHMAFSGGSSVINSMGLFLPTLMFGLFFSAHEVGLLALAQKIAIAPTSAISTAIYQSFWGEAAQAKHSQRNDLQNTFKRTSLLLFTLSAPLFLFCLAGPLFMGMVFGGKAWGSTGSLLAALAPSVATQLVASTLSPVITMSGGASWVFFWDCARTAVVALSVIFFAFSGASFLITVIAYSAVMAAMYIVLYFKAKRIVAEHFAL